MQHPALESQPPSLGLADSSEMVRATNTTRQNKLSENNPPLVSFANSIFKTLSPGHAAKETSSLRGSAPHRIRVSDRPPQPEPRDAALDSSAHLFVDYFLSQYSQSPMLSHRRATIQVIPQSRSLLSDHSEQNPRDNAPPPTVTLYDP